MTVRLTKAEIEKFVEEQVRSGHYDSREAVVEAALEQMMEIALDEETLAAIDESEAQIERGEFLDWKQVSADLRKKHLGPV